MIDEQGNYVVKNITASLESGEQVVLFDSRDLIEWLRADHNLTDEELALCNELADQLNWWALSALAQNLDSRLES